MCYIFVVGDDIKSTVSDSWSTDVLASDSEPPEQNQLDRLEEVVEEPPNLLGVRGVVEERGHLLGAHEVSIYLHLSFDFAVGFFGT